MKKAMSVLLAVIMIFSIMMPCMAVNEEYPTIYVVGTMEEIYDSEGNQVFPIGIDVGSTILNALMPCISKLVVGLVTKDYEAYAQEFYDAFVPLFKDAILDKNGEVTNGTDVEEDSYSVALPEKTSGFGYWDYVFWYDWRKSPMDTHTELRDFIERVQKATGKNKVNLLSRCYGSNVVATYLQKNQEHAIENVKAVTYYTPSVTGIDFLSALFSGEICLEGDAIDNFVNHFIGNGDLISDEGLKSLVVALVELFNQIKALDLATDAVELLIDEVKGALIPKLLRDSYGAWPSYWAMVTPELYEQARDFIFAGYEEEYAKFIEKTDAYYNEVQLTFGETTKHLKSKGIGFYSIAKYNFPCIPLFENATVQSDGYTTLRVQSFGAVSADYGKVLTDDYIASVDNKKYISPDRIIDASTCLLPETTWFVKDLYHDDFNEVLYPLILDVMRNDITVSDEKYPQFLQYTTDTLSEVKAIGEDELPEEKNILTSLIKFFKSLITVIVGLFK